MKRDVTIVRALLAPEHDPAADIGSGEALPHRAERDLAGLRASANVPSNVAKSAPVFGRRRVLALTAVAAAGVATVVWRNELPWRGQPQPAAAVTPPVLDLVPVADEPEVYLREFAKRVERLPAETQVMGIQYTKQWGWWLNTAADVPGGAVNAAVPTITESWVHRDGGGRERATTGEPIFPRAEQEDRARKYGLTAGKKIEEEDRKPGTFAWQSPWQAMEPIAEDPAHLARQLANSHPEGGHIVYGVGDLLTYKAMSGSESPQLRAAALRVLAARKDVRVSTSRTWHGRHVVAVTQESETQGSINRNSVLFDANTGHVVGTEEAILGNPLRLNVKTPATLAVTEILGHRDSADK
ncbi:hypothetical protein [Streptomyces purpurascens]|uniref:hypothetical protein n=1 Tax=Streptomyces purpurascens TaxID=1924 RepID=UPI0033EB5106